MDVPVPTPVVVIEPEPYVFTDDPNPRSLLVYHPSGVCTASEGGCRPRILAECAGCGAVLNHCLPSEAEVSALKRGVWRCSDCMEGCYG